MVQWSLQYRYFQRSRARSLKSRFFSYAYACSCGSFVKLSSPHVGDNLALASHPRMGHSHMTLDSNTNKRKRTARPFAKCFPASHLPSCFKGLQFFYVPSGLQRKLALVVFSACGRIRTGSNFLTAYFPVLVELNASWERVPYQVWDLSNQAGTGCTELQLIGNVWPTTKR